MFSVCRICLILLGSILTVHAHAAITVRDDTGKTVTLPQAAQRVVSLAPHATELLFAAGGEGRIIATVSYSDYPPAARKLPHIGDNQQIDIEQLMALKPDLLVAWRHSASTRQLEKLRKLGIPLFYSDPLKLDDIPASLENMGRLMGTEQQARQSADELSRRIDNLIVRYRSRSTVRVFYQVWHKPIFTLNEQNIISDAIRICGGENIFGKLTMAAVSITPEAVLREDPEAIVSGEENDQKGNGIEIWKQYPAMLAVRRGNLFMLDADLVNRPGPRIVDGAAQLCARLEQARQRRKEKP